MFYLYSGIFLLIHVKLDLKEREAARDLFKSKKGKVLAKEIAQKSKFLSAEAGNKAPIGKTTNVLFC